MATASANGNPVPIYIYSHPEEVPTPASVYASVAIIRNLEGPISDVRVTLQGFSHEAPEDVDVLLVSPTGTGVIVMSDAGGQFAIPDPGVDITISDKATRDLPEFDRIAGGTYRPTNYDDVEQGQQPFPFPAPEPPYQTTMSAFNGEDPTPENDGSGRWLLFVVDDGPFGADGAIYAWTPTVSTGGSGPAAPSTPDQAPSSDSGASGTDNVTKDNTPTFRGTATAGTEVRLFANGTQVGSSPITNGNYSVTADLADGTYSITARAVDAQGNEGDESGGIDVTIDTAAPPVPDVPDLTPESDTGTSNTDNVTSDTTPTFTGRADEAATVTLVAGGRPIGSGPVAADGTYNVTVSPALVTGNYDVFASSTDLAGNFSSPSSSLHVVIQAPVVEFGGVSQVFVNGPGLTAANPSADQAAFRAAAGIDATYGYAIPAGANQLKATPWIGGVSAVAIRLTGFAGPLEQGDLQLRGVAVPTYAFQGFAYDAATRTGVWTLAQPVTNDKLRLVLDDALVPGLDGEWNNGADTYPSGDNAVGGDFDFRVNVLTADATQDGQVNALDLSFIKQRLNRTALNPGASGATYSVFGDLNGDGKINALDLSAAKQRVNRHLPTGEPAATALLFSDRRV